MPDRLRILHVLLSRGFAGSERAAAELCNAFAAEHEAAIVVRRDHRSAGGASILDHIDPRVAVFELAPYWRTRAALGEVMAEWRPDIVHTHLRRGTRYVAQLARPVPHVATLHIDLNGPHYLGAQALCCISPWQADTLREAGYAGTVLEIPNSLVPHPRVTPERRAELRTAAGAGPDDFLIGGVGRLVPGKGFDVLIDGLRESALPDARLVIVGEGHARTRLERLAEGLPVTFTGFRHDAKDWYQAFDVFVSPSRREPFGRVIIESLDAGTPVIATRTQGPADIARSYPIELVTPGDPGDLARALRTVHQRPRQRMAVDLSEFHVGRIAERLIEAYRQLLVAPAARASGVGAQAAA
jgi:glycosyltransferase involved in cell wall biosynthesis